MGSSAPPRPPRARSMTYRPRYPNSPEASQPAPTQFGPKTRNRQGAKAARRRNKKSLAFLAPWRFASLTGFGDGNVSPAIALRVLEPQETALLLGEARVALRNAHVSGEGVEHPQRRFGVVGGPVGGFVDDSQARADLAERLALLHFVELACPDQWIDPFDARRKRRRESLAVVPRALELGENEASIEERIVGRRNH